MVDLIKKPIKISDSLLDKIQEKEKSIGIQLPASLKEFYCIEGLVDCLGGACDNFPTKLEELSVEESGIIILT